MPDAVATPAPTAAEPAAIPSPGLEAIATPAPVADVDISADELKRFASLSKASRLAKERIKELEAKLAAGEGNKTAAERLAAFEAAKSSGKRLDALKAIGMDSVEELDALIAEAMAVTPDVPNPALDAMKGELDAVKKRLEDEDKAKADADVKAKEAQTAAAKATVTAVVEGMVKADAAKFPRVAKAGAKATAKIVDAVTDAARKLGRAVSDEEANKLFTLAIEEQESEYKALVDELYIPETQPATRPVGRTRPIKEVDVGAVDTLTIDNKRGTVRSTPEPKVYTTAKEAKRLVLERMKHRARTA